jgi:hypothetical protein
VLAPPQTERCALRVRRAEGAILIHHRLTQPRRFSTRCRAVCATRAPHTRGVLPASSRPIREGKAGHTSAGSAVYAARGTRHTTLSFTNDESSPFVTLFALPWATMPFIFDRAQGQEVGGRAMVWTTNVVRELPYRPGVDEAEPVCLSEREVALLASRGVLDDKRIRHLHRKGAIAGLDRAYTQVGVLQPRHRQMDQPIWVWRCLLGLGAAGRGVQAPVAHA